MALADAVEAARHTAQQITWTDTDGNAVNLTSSTITGKIRQTSGSTPRSIDGTLALVTAASGIFSWTYGALDVGTPGDVEVQFIATFAGPVADKTTITTWRIHEALDT